ncbi:MAG TPA: class I SAM-dependent methyltransferase [Polyangia bacterium]|jgi:2-polyprenyl-3-methyl-5-hydroxy-6-metoxy-1,4-benzoquinol methylase|nr:class I SAM-dependent methyltransferase [Polyangia bacterium]
MTPVTLCRLCAGETVHLLSDFGPQPLCNRFLEKPDEVEYCHPLRVGFCRRCAAVQLVDPAPAAEVRPRFPWITYTEMEGHLDSLVDRLIQRSVLTAEAVVGGLTFKDDSTLRRFQERGFTHTWRLHPAEDLGITEAGAGLETIQDRLAPATAKAIARRLGPCDLLLVRHMLEHVHDVGRFLLTLQELVKPGGHLVFEVPDQERALAKMDYSTLWEEHTLYFTPVTFHDSFLKRYGTPVDVVSFPYFLENSLVGVVRNQPGLAPSFPAGGDLDREESRTAEFARGVGPRKDFLRRILTDARREKGKIALLGAGHLSCAFVNLLGLQDLFDCVVDDNPRKQGLSMPGSHLPIASSSALTEHDIRLCLLSVNPDSEQRAIDKNRRFIDSGGCFASIFPDSAYALKDKEAPRARR